MKHGKRELPRKRKPLLTRVLLTAAVVGLAVVGVAAYLSHGSNSVENKFTVENHPVVTVSDSGITVSDLDYAVYLRAAVVVNWVNKENGNILAVQPVADTDYTLQIVDTSWKKGDDGFYYCTEKITSNESVSLPVAITQIEEKEGYTLKVFIAAQTVQAVGETDDGTKSAVMDAWGVDPDSLANSASSN